MTLEQIKEAAIDLPGLVVRLDRIAELMERQINQSTEALATLRGKLNECLWSGTIRLKELDSNGNYFRRLDFEVPFAAVGWVDSNAIGPVVLSTKDEPPATIATAAGVGTVTTFGKDSGVLPLVGDPPLLRVTSATSGLIFVAVFTATQPMLVL